MIDEYYLIRMAASSAAGIVGDEVGCVAVDEEDHVASAEA